MQLHPVRVFSSSIHNKETHAHTQAFVVVVVVAVVVVVVVGGGGGGGDVVVILLTLCMRFVGVDG